jgi:hypothetical protein
LLVRALAEADGLRLVSRIRIPIRSVTSAAGRLDESGTTEPVGPPFTVAAVLPGVLAPRVWEVIEIADTKGKRHAPSYWKGLVDELLPMQVEGLARVPRIRHPGRSIHGRRRSEMAGAPRRASRPLHRETCPAVVPRRFENGSHLAPWQRLFSRLELSVPVTTHGCSRDRLLSCEIRRSNLDT